MTRRGMTRRGAGSQARATAPVPSLSAAPECPPPSCPDAPLRHARTPPFVMPGLVPGIHAAVRGKRRKGMPGTSPGMTRRGVTRRGMTGRGVTGRGVTGRGSGRRARQRLLPPRFPPCPNAPSVMPGRPLRHARTPPPSCPDGLSAVPGRAPLRHARTCSGHPCGRAAETVEGDARNKSGHDGERHDEKRRDAEEA